MGPGKGAERTGNITNLFQEETGGHGPNAARLDESRGAAACSAAGTAPVGNLGGRGGGGRAASQLVRRRGGGGSQKKVVKNILVKRLRSKIWSNNLIK